jgi:hypothetical protein
LYEKLSFVSSPPDRKSPVSLATVCGSSSALTHVTVVRFDRQRRKTEVLYQAFGLRRRPGARGKPPSGESQHRQTE